MKATFAVVVILCVFLGALLLMNQSKARKQQEAAQVEIQSLSNQVAELDTRLMLDKGNAALTQSNLQSQLDAQLKEWLGLSNRLAEVRANAAAIQKVLAATQTELASRQLQASQREQERNALQARLTPLLDVQKERDVKETELLEARRTINALTEELGAMRVQNADLNRQMEEPAFLQLQLEKAKEWARLRERAAKSGQPVPDPKAPLVLLPDGTVKLAVQTTESPPN